MRGFRFWVFPSLVVVALLTALALSGCGRSTPEADSGATTPPVSESTAGNGGKGTTGGDFKVALVMTGATSDNGWNGTAAKAWEELRKEMNLSPENAPSVENQKSPSEQEKSLRAFAKDGSKIVFGHGNEYESIALKLEADYPNTLFVISSGRKVDTHVTPIVFQLEDGAYLEGMLAAGMSKTGKLAFVGAEQIPPLVSTFKAFVAGAKAVKPGITILPAAYTGDWGDAAKAKDATLPLIGQGADVIMQDVDSAAPGVFNAVQESAKSGKTVYALGTNSDQNHAAPDVILASAPIDTGKAFVQIAEGVKAGTFKPNDKPFDMKSGVIGFVFNPQLEAKIPADLKKKIMDTQEAIKSGKFSVMDEVKKGS